MNHAAVCVVDLTLSPTFGSGALCKPGLYVKSSPLDSEVISGMDTLFHHCIKQNVAPGYLGWNNQERGDPAFAGVHGLTGCKFTAAGDHFFK